MVESRQDLGYSTTEVQIPPNEQQVGVMFSRRGILPLERAGATSLRCTSDAQSPAHVAVVVDAQPPM
jgi:hypothetical protein